MAHDIGDVVQLRSGGPIMTVIGTADDGDTICTWFDPAMKMQHGAFPPSALKQIDMDEEN